MPGPALLIPLIPLFLSLSLLVCPEGSPACRKVSLYSTTPPQSSRLPKLSHSHTHLVDPRVVYHKAVAELVGGVALRFATEDRVDALARPPPHLHIAQPRSVELAVAHAVVKLALLVLPIPGIVPLAAA
eukprot:349688-Chlamydomonas_euryale.AAC.3